VPLALALAGIVVMQVADADEPAQARNRVRIRPDSEVSRAEPAPHDGSGQTTAYRYFDDIKDAGVIFRKRALPKGSSIGVHALEHDEVYYVLGGEAELTIDGATQALKPATAVYMDRGVSVGIRQTGDADLVIIVAYPPVK
jgi:mannose-6-phosphate isomerase-like protein (cupin superfamily)